MCCRTSILPVTPVIIKAVWYSLRRLIASSKLGIGDYVMGPGPTTYDKRVQYLTFDVTSRFAQPGSKTLDVTLYDGWYALERDPWVHGFHQKPVR